MVVFAADIAKFFFTDAHTVYGFLTVIYLVLMVPAWTMWLGILLAEVPVEFFKGAVVIRGPGYAEGVFWPRFFTCYRCVCVGLLTCV